MKTIRQQLQAYPLFYFFALAYLASWILWLPLIYGITVLGWTSWEGNTWTNYKAILGLLGALGPALSAIIITRITDGKDALKSLLAKAFQWRVKIWSWTAALYFWWFLCSVLALVYGFTSFRNIAVGFGISLINLPALILVLQLPTLLIGMFGEELGWRGFALPKLLSKYNPIVASLILALFWVFWHTPLALFPAWRDNLPISLFLIRYLLMVIPLTMIFTFFFQKVKGSILLMMVFHASVNLTFNAYAEALNLEEKFKLILKDKLIIALWIIAGTIVIHYLYKSITVQKKEKHIEPEALAA